uniref:ZP domain-containing protein n=1 Tax=Ascaris lumbricoides TaxID=6252 RepID=A0A0M3IUA7_ASCLU
LSFKGGGHGKEGNVGSTLLRTSSPLADREVYGSMSGINDHLRCPPCPVCESGRRTTRQAGTVANIDIQLGTCNTKRARSLSPPGVTISFTIVVSFHENFVTKVDRAYRIQCAYAEIDKTVTTKIDVSMPQSTELTGTIDSPKCEYRIKGQSGEPVKNVRVGDIIEHEWSCSGGTAGTYAILVSNCYAEGGDHQKELVIDKRGCSLDSFVIPTPEYNNNEMLATAKSIVFKFPDRTDIGFQCDILVCARGENICDQLTVIFHSTTLKFLHNA